MFFQIFFWFFLLLVRFSTEWYLFTRFFLFFAKFAVFNRFLGQDFWFFDRSFFWFLWLPVQMSTELCVFAVSSKVSRIRLFFRRFQSVFGVLGFFHCFLNVSSNFLLVFVVTCQIVYRIVFFCCIFNCFQQSQPFSVVFQVFLERFWLFLLLSQCFFEFSFGFSCFLSDSLPKDTFFLVLQRFFAKLAVFGRFLGVFRAFLVF